MPCVDRGPHSPAWTVREFLTGETVVVYVKPVRVSGQELRLRVVLVIEVAAVEVAAWRGRRRRHGRGRRCRCGRWCVNRLGDRAPGAEPAAVQNEAKSHGCGPVAEERASGRVAIPEDCPRRGRPELRGPIQVL